MTPNMQALLVRLEKLERAFAAMTQERASLRVVEANAFVLKDSEGRVRAVLQMEEMTPEARLEWGESHEARAVLTLYDNKGKPRAQLREGILMVGEGNDHCAKLTAFEKAGAQLALIEGGGKERSVAGLCATKDGPQIVVEDAEGNKTVIGNLYAGSFGYKAWKDLADKRGSGVSKQELSAVSIVMVAAKGEKAVIWRAP
jgi:hypothetical protein